MWQFSNLFNILYCFFFICFSIVLYINIFSFNMSSMYVFNFMEIKIKNIVTPSNETTAVINSNNLVLQ